MTVFSSKPEAYDGVLEIVDENDRVTTGGIVKATSDMSEAMDGCLIAFVTQPAFMLKRTSEQMSPYISPGLSILCPSWNRRCGIRFSVVYESWGCSVWTSKSSVSSKAGTVWEESKM